MGASAVAQRRLPGQVGLACVLLWLLATGCSSGPVAPTAGTSPSASAAAATPSPDAAAARQTIEAVDITNPDSIDAVDALRFTEAGVQAARDVLASSPADVNVTWAATWVYASSASDPGTLVPLLQHGDPSVRAIAAAGAVANGDATGFAVLRDLIADESQMRGSQPPLTVGTFAWATVSRYVVAADAPPSPASADGMPASRQAWATWLAEHAAGLTYDSANGTWSGP